LALFIEIKAIICSNFVNILSLQINIYETFEYFLNYYAHAHVFNRYFEY